MSTGVCHSPAVWDEPGGSGVVWSRGESGPGTVKPRQWWGLCLAGGPTVVAQSRQLRGCLRHGAVGGVCGEPVAFCLSTPSVPVQNTGQVRRKHSSEVSESITRMTSSSLTDDWSVSPVWDQTQ